jgi:hypothetical protein
METSVIGLTTHWSRRQQPPLVPRCGCWRGSPRDPECSAAEAHQARGGDASRRSRHRRSQGPKPSRAMAKRSEEPRNAGPHVSATPHTHMQVQLNRSTRDWTLGGVLPTVPSPRRGGSSGWGEQPRGPHPHPHPPPSKGEGNCCPLSVPILCGLI